MARNFSGFLKRVALQVVVRTPVRWGFGLLLQNSAPIFMLHRFADRERGVAGHDPAALKQHLAWLRRQRYRFVSIEQLVQLLVENPKAVTRTVCLTVDDGYEDFARLGWPVLSEFDCPVTVFLATDFIDRKMWFWWDRIEYAFAHSDKRSCTVQLSQGLVTVNWNDAVSRSVATEKMVEILKHVPEADRLSGLQQIPAHMHVDVPERAPAEYAPLSWEQIRHLETQGVAFGPHSVTHPILSQTSDIQSEREIVESWRRLEQATSRPSPVFCYPNGKPEDFSIREMKTARATGLVGAIATHPEYASADSTSGGGAFGRYALPRFPWPESAADLVQIVAGVERAKALVRSALSRARTPSDR